MEKICIVIAGTMMIVTPLLLLIWIAQAISRKPAKKLGIACLICAVCFVLSVIVGAFSSPTAVDGAKYVKYAKTNDEKKVAEAVETEKTYEKEVKSFSSKRKVSLELAQSIKDAMEQPGCPFSLGEINGWEQTEDWASGKRYQAWHYDVHEDKYFYVLIYTKNDAVVSIYDTTDGRKLIYEGETGKQGVTSTDDGSIRLVDGVIGEYGKSVKVANQAYIWYSIPCGSYEVNSNVPYSTVFVVSDEDSNDVPCSLQLQMGEVGVIKVEEGTHIELSMNADVSLRTH